LSYLSVVNSAQFTLEMRLAAQNRQKIKKTYFGVQSHPIEFGGNQEPVYDFLLVINSNLGLSRTVIEIQRIIG